MCNFCVCEVLAYNYGNYLIRMLVLFLILVTIHKVGIIADSVPGCRNMLIVVVTILALYWSKP
jgi:hypothetical protein